MSTQAASELEFVVADAERRPLFDGVDIFATLQLAKTDFAYAVAEQITTVDVRTMNCEYGAGQLEITFKPKRGVAAADCAHTFKTGVKELAMRRGLAATFASKPFGGPRGVGNGGHLNVSLWRGDDPATGGDEDGLSPTARHFIAGVLAHARGLEALAAPTPGCYARHGNWAPTHATWNHDDRTVCVRVKSRDCAPGEAYVEYMRGVVAFTRASRGSVRHRCD
jgi:glutamine synthetase